MVFLDYPLHVASKDKQRNSAPEPAESPKQPGQAGKGRATRSRKEAEAQRRRPLIPADRQAAKKEAKRLQREREREYYAKQREAMRTGDDRYMPLRDRGRVRRFIRDYVDSRYKLSEFILFVMVICLVAMLGFAMVPLSASTTNLILSIVTYGFYALLILSVLEGLITWRMLKPKIRSRYPNDDLGRVAWFYMYTRMLTFRRMRSPSPLVKRGEYPDKQSRQARKEQTYKDEGRSDKPKVGE